MLDMGKPVHIYDLARDLITLSGFEPDIDIPIASVINNYGIMISRPQSVPRSEIFMSSSESNLQFMVEAKR